MAGLNKAYSLFFLVVLSLFLTNVSQAKTTSVWKVSKGKDYLYIAGTVHLLPPNEFPLPSAFVNAYYDSQSIVLEAEMPDSGNPAAQAAMMQKMQYPAGKTLSRVLNKKTTSALTNYLKELGITLSQVDQFKPGFLSIMMLTLELQKAQMAGEGVDAFFSKLASREGKPIEYLESADFQMSLISSMGEGNENAFVMSSIGQMEDFEKIFGQSIAAWRAGDTAGIYKLMMKPMLDEDPKTYKTLMVNRNKDWLPKVTSQFKDNDKELILVGVGHLVGNESLLQLLKAQGYIIERL